jgi:tetratricopeptide (TPR) repeat protein
MSDRFECPRCQHVFTSEAADQAFAECPKCGSLALPREVSAEGAAVPAADPEVAHDDSAAAGFESMSLTDALGTAHNSTFATTGEAPVPTPAGQSPLDTEVGPAPQPPASGLDSGIFQGLLPDEPAAEMPPGALHSDPGADPIATTEGAPEGPTLADVGSVPSAPSGEALPPSMALTRALSGEGAPVTSEPAAPAVGPDAGEPPLPPSVALTRGAEDDGGDFASAATRTYTADPSALFGSPEGGEEHSDDFDPFKGIDLPSGGDSVDLSLPAGGQPLTEGGAFADAPTMQTAPLGADTDVAAFQPGVPPEMSLSDEANAFASGDVTAVGPAPTQMDTEVGAVTLSELERQLPEGTPLEMFNLGAGADLFGDEAFGDLERAFDDVASTPDAPAFEPQTTKTAEELVEEAIAAQVAEEAGTPDAPRPPDGPSPPPLRLRKQVQVPHLSLTAEAIEAAALPITSMEVSSLNPAPADPFNEVQDSPNVNFLDEETDIVLRRPTSQPGESSPKVMGTASVSEEGGSATSQTALTPIEGEKRLFSGFTLGRVVAAAIFFGLVGAILGGLVAPSDADKPRTKSDRAREIYAKGNRFYEEGRFDDALGDYRSALAIDPSFTPALRAKGAALAKQRRYKEAARAYEEYLERDPQAFDAAQVREVLARYRGEDEEEDS